MAPAKLWEILVVIRFQTFKWKWGSFLAGAEPLETTENVIVFGRNLTLWNMGMENRTDCEQFHFFVLCWLWVVSLVLTRQVSEAHRDICPSTRWQSYPLAHHNIKQSLAGTLKGKKIKHMNT